MPTKFTYFDYLKDHPDETENIMAGVEAFGGQEVEDLLQRAIKEHTKIEFYYKTDDDMKADLLSFRFI